MHTGLEPSPSACLLTWKCTGASGQKASGCGLLVLLPPAAARPALRPAPLLLLLLGAAAHPLAWAAGDAAERLTAQAGLSAARKLCSSCSPCPVTLDTASTGTCGGAGGAAVG
jgi:hypothetical protein